MKRDHVIAALRAHEPELKRAGIARLWLFGSTARGEDAPRDVDLLAAFDEHRQLSMLDVIHIENQHTDLLGYSVDLIAEGTIKPRVKKSVAAEVIRAF